MDNYNLIRLPILASTVLKPDTENPLEHDDTMVY